MDEDREVACVLESCDVPEDRLHEAVATCPEACIFVEEDDERR
jgi:ferredoxin